MPQSWIRWFFSNRQLWHPWKSLFFGSASGGNRGKLCQGCHRRVSSEPGERSRSLADSFLWPLASDGKKRVRTTATCTDSLLKNEASIEEGETTVGGEIHRCPRSECRRKGLHCFAWYSTDARDAEDSLLDRERDRVRRRLTSQANDQSTDRHLGTEIDVCVTSQPKRTCKPSASNVSRTQLEWSPSANRERGKVSWSEEARWAPEQFLLKRQRWRDRPGRHYGCACAFPEFSACAQPLKSLSTQPSFFFFFGAPWDRADRTSSTQTRWALRAFFTSPNQMHSMPLEMTTWARGRSLPADTGFVRAAPVAPVSTRRACTPLEFVLPRTRTLCPEGVSSSIFFTILLDHLFISFSPERGVYTCVLKTFFFCLPLFSFCCWNPFSHQKQITVFFSHFRSKSFRICFWNLFSISHFTFYLVFFLPLFFFFKKKMFRYLFLKYVSFCFPYDMFIVLLVFHLLTSISFMFTKLSVFLWSKTFLYICNTFSLQKKTFMIIFQKKKMLTMAFVVFFEFLFRITSLLFVFPIFVTFWVFLYLVLPFLPLYLLFECFFSCFFFSFFAPWPLCFVFEMFWLFLKPCGIKAAERKYKAGNENSR